MPEEILLHQYAVSPFSEKVRKLLAFKRMRWRSVDQPIIAPKPKLIPLTGGYRRIPVLQIGADIYCDTALIARVLEERKPEPSCFPSGSVGACEIIAHWADHWLFMAAVPPGLVSLLPTLPPEFMKDRQAMSPAFTAQSVKESLPDCRNRLVAAMDWLAAQLNGRDFLFGSSFSVADAACFHPLWFLRSNPDAFTVVSERPALARWFQRVDAMGHGDVSPLDPDEALAIARHSLPLTPEGAQGGDPNGLKPGDRVVVTADDYGSETVTGELVRTSAQDVALRREDTAVGEVIVHFPRIGYRIRRA
jgi:glutathione S-transferase